MRVGDESNKSLGSKSPHSTLGQLPPFLSLKITVNGFIVISSLRKASLFGQHSRGNCGPGNLSTYLISINRYLAISPVYDPVQASAFPAGAANSSSSSSSR